MTQHGRCEKVLKIRGANVAPVRLPDIAVDGEYFSVSVVRPAGGSIEVYIAQGCLDDIECVSKNHFTNFDGEVHELIKACLLRR